MGTLWRAVDGDVRVPTEEAEWWGAALAVLVAVTHHPVLLAAGQPQADPAEVARHVLDSLDELQAAAASAARQPGRDEAGERPSSISVRAEGDEVVFSPGAEVADLGFCLTVFATAVLEPASAEASIARGATAYTASAWSADIGKASGALEGMDGVPTLRPGTGPGVSPEATRGPAEAFGRPSRRVSARPSPGDCAREPGR